MPDFSDIPGALYDARMQNLQNRFNDVTGMFEDPYETMRRRMGLPAEGNTRPVVQTIKTNPQTGEQEMTIKGNPRDLSAANPNTPTVVQPGGYMNLANSASTQPVAYQPAPAIPVPPSLNRQAELDRFNKEYNVNSAYDSQGRLVNQSPPTTGVPAGPATPAPVAPDNYNARIAQMESSGNTSMGYHNPAVSSAYGPYGITRAAYQDVQAANPAFANRPITSLNPQEQTQAMETYTKKNAEYLNNYGIEPTAGNLAAAHFLGAKGYSDYLKTGRISPEAAAANGGEERVRQIVEQRRAIGQAPATAVAGPVQPGQPQMVRTVAPAGGAQPAPTSWQDTLSTIQNDPTKLAAFIGDEKNSPEARTVAGELLKREYRKKDEADRAGQIAMNALGGDPQAQNELVRELRNKEGSYLKAYLFNRLGLTALAQQEQQKLGAGTTFGRVQLDNQNYAVETDAQGAVVNAWDPTGKKVDNNTLAKINAGGVKAGTHRYSFTGETAIDPVTKEEVRQRQDAISGNVDYVYATGPKAGQVYRGSTPTAKSIQTAASKGENALVLKLKEQYGTDVIKAWNEYQRWMGPGDENARIKFFKDWGYDFARPTGTTMPPVTLPGGIPSAPVPAAPAGPDAVQQGQMNDAEGVRQNMKRVPGAAVPVAPTQVQAAPVQPGATPAPTGPDFSKPLEVVKQEQQAKTAGQKEITTKAGEVIAMSADTRNLMNSITKAETILDSGQHNVGSVASVVGGRGPIAQAVGSQLETKDARNTKLILDTVNKLATEGLKVLGANPSTADLKFWTENKPNGSTDPEVMKEWIKSRREDLERRLVFAEKQVSTGGTAGAAPPVPAVPKQETGAAKAGTTKTINGVTYEFDGRGWKRVSGI